MAVPMPPLNLSMPSMAQSGVSGGNVSNPFTGGSINMGKDHSIPMYVLAGAIVLGALLWRKR